LTVNLLKSCGLNAARVSDGFKANSQKAFKLIFGAA